MANPHRGVVEFESAGAKYKLSFSAEAICVLEESVDAGFNDIIGQLADTTKFRMGVVRKLLAAGLSDHHPDLTDDALKKIMRGIGPKDALNLVQKAIALAYGGDDAGDPPVPGQPSEGPAGSAT